MAVATTADHQQRLENPLLQEFPFPLFDAVEAKHVIPGIKTILQDLVSFCFVLMLDYIPD
jgi:hypothetical protein